MRERMIDRRWTRQGLLAAGRGGDRRLRRLSQRVLCLSSFSDQHRAYQFADNKAIMNRGHFHHRGLGVCKRALLCVRWIIKRIGFAVVQMTGGSAIAGASVGSEASRKG